MDRTAIISSITTAITSAKSIAIVTHERPNHDGIAASLALLVALESLGKSVSVSCPDPMTVEFSNYVGVNKVSTELGKRNFVISLDYVEGSIEKVSYHIDGNRFNLVIEPRDGYEGYNSDKVHFTTSGAQADVVIAIDTIHIGGLKHLYEKEKALFTDKPVIVIDRHPNNAQFGTTNFIDSQASSTTELVYEIIQALGVAITEDIGTNLLAGVTHATHGFSHPQTSAAAFELASVCMKAGAKRPVRPVKPHHGKDPNGMREANKSSVPSDTLTPAVSKNETLASDQAANEQDWLQPKIAKTSSTE